LQPTSVTLKHDSGVCQRQVGQLDMLAALPWPCPRQAPELVEIMPSVASTLICGTPLSSMLRQHVEGGHGLLGRVGLDGADHSVPVMRSNAWAQSPAANTRLALVCSWASVSTCVVACNAAAFEKPIAGRHADADSDQVGRYRRPLDEHLHGLAGVISSTWCR
jgi:hypothetical protein